MDAGTGSRRARGHDDTVSLGRRLRQPRTIVSIADPARPAHRSAFRRAQGRLRDRSSPAIAGATRCSSSPPSSSSTRASRCAACAGRCSCAGTGSGSASRTPPRSCTSRGSSTASCPAKLGDVYRAYLLKINSAGLAVADVRHGVHRAHPGPVRDRDPRARGRASGASGPGLPPEIQVVAALGVVIVVLLAVALFTLRNFGRRILVALPLPHRVAGALRPVRGGRVRRRRRPAAARPRRPHRSSSGCTEAAAPVPRRPGARLPGREPRDLRGVLRGAHRLAADGRAAEPGRAWASSRPASSASSSWPTGSRSTEATTIALLDRVISVFSIIVLGSILYVVLGQARRAPGSSSRSRCRRPRPDTRPAAPGHRERPHAPVRDSPRM